MLVNAELVAPSILLVRSTTAQDRLNDEFSALDEAAQQANPALRECILEYVTGDDRPRVDSSVFTCIGALGPGHSPAERGPSLESTYRVSLQLIFAKVIR